MTRVMRGTVSISTAVMALGLSGVVAADGSSGDWVTRSNELAQKVLLVMARYEPEDATEYGVEGFDDQVLDLKRGNVQRARSDLQRARAELQEALGKEQSPLVRQDLEIMIEKVGNEIRGSELEERYELPYFDVPKAVFNGLHALLEDRISPARRQVARVRAQRYAGMLPGTEPLTALAEARWREQVTHKELLGPSRVKIEKNLSTVAFFIDGIDKLFAKYKVDDGGALARLRTQFGDYAAFVRAEVLPRARDDFRLPPEQYAFSLVRFGVDIPPAELAKLAHAAATDIEAQMDTLAARVAQERGWKATGYRAVIAQLKKEQLGGGEILAHYEHRLADLENIIRTRHLVTLPARAARIRLATEAESAQQPAPHMSPPRLVGNTGERGEFIVPVRIPAAPGDTHGAAQYDDFTFAAASWTLTAHEARPGHELQFAAMVEHGVSLARALFAFNSTNVEGWGLYAEAISLPFMPPEGQLISLQHRLMRAHRAFVDPELQAGILTPAAAKELLMRDVVLSDALATEEIERYTFRAPGQATSYFYGYTRLQQLRADVEKALGPKFDAQKFHDCILAQGLLPSAQLRKAVFAELVAAK